MKQLDLVVPGLCGPLPELEGLSESPVMDSLSKWLSRADKKPTTGSSFYAELARLFGLDEDTTIPSAALSLLGHGHVPAEGQWFHADPVHLQADMDHAILRDSQSLDISTADAGALVDELNAHFKDDKVQLVAIDQNHWFINMGEHGDVATTPLHDVIGRNVNFFLPKGNDESFFKGLMNESQMLLHMSVVNQNREQAGQLAVNSLWLWGEGELPARKKTGFQHVYSNHALIKGLAKTQGIRHHPLVDAESFLSDLDDSPSSIVVLDDLFTIACYGDVCAWQESVEGFYDNWFLPIATHAVNKKITLNVFPCNGAQYSIRSGNRYRLFRRANIRNHIALYE